MEKHLRYFLAPLIFIIISGSAAAQTPPVIHYTPATNVYTVNSAITTLSPINTGGAVTANSLTTFATIPGGDQPYGIAYDPTTGDIITDDFSDGDVFRYSPSGVLLNTYTTSIYNGGPKDIVVDNSGNIFVANGLGGNIVKITPAGVTTTISATGTAFNQPDGMTINRTTGVIYIADQGTNDVYSIASGATVATVYKSGFTNAYGVTVNAATGVVYVSEYTPQADIKQIAAGGGAVTTFISKLAGGFTDLRNLDIDAAGNLFVANYGNNSIDEFSSTGVFIAHVVTGLSNPRATAEDVFGNLYIANSGGSNVKEYSTAFYSINIPLPAGMSFNTTTGQISGTPTVTSPTTVYTIVGHNAGGSGYTTVTITVDPTGPTAPGVNLCGAGTATLTATAGAPAGGTFNWYAASSGGSALATGATYSPFVSTTTTFYVDYVQGGVTCAVRTAVTVTVGSNPIISTAPTSGTYFSYGFTAGSLSHIGGTNNGVQHGSPATTLDRYNTSGNALNFVRTSSQYISTTTSYSTPGPATFSISAWFNTSTAGGYIAGFGSSQTGSSTNVDRVVYIGTDGKLYFGLAPGGVKKTMNTVTTYNDGDWHHVVVTFSAANGSNMYVDGALTASDPTMTAARGVTGWWRVGFDALTGYTSAPTTTANTYFNGALDDIAAANTELTLAQINVLYGAGSSSNFCAGNALALTANTVAGATYSWMGPAGSGFTSSLQNPTVPAANAIAGIYELTVTSATGCTSVIDVTAPSNVITYTWSGAAGTTSPLTAGNWDRLPLFTNTTNLVIPTGLAKYPVLTANETIYGLTLASGATFSLGGFTLNMGCNIYNSSGGQILYGGNNASGINWNGSLAAQYYYGKNTANTAQVGTMTVNNSAAGTINISGGPLDIYSLLTMTKGAIAVGASPAALTLKSSATQTANVAVVPSACSITGNVNVERYIQGASVSTPGVQKRGYRLISSAVFTGTPSGVKVFDLKYLLNNIYVSGLNGAANGFSASPFNNPTLYLFREDSKPPPSKTTLFRTQYNWKGIANINYANAYDIGVPFRNNYTSNAADTITNIPLGNGVLMYFRGDNSATSNGTTAGTKFSQPYNYPESATTTQVGTLNTGTVNVKMWFANAANGLGNNFSYTSTYVGTTTWLSGGYACVGNPYASTINWEKYNRNGTNSSIYGTVSTIIYMFNEANQQYQTYKQSTTPISTVADTTTAINPGTAQGSASNMIASGQGFFVIASGPGQTLSFRETAKTSTQPPAATLPNLMSKGAPKAFAEAPEPLLRLKLFSDTIRTDEIVIRMNSQSSNKYVFNEDALDLGGSGALVSLSAYSSDSTQLSIDYRPYPGKQPMVIPLMADAGLPGTYKLVSTQLDNLPILYEAWLKDAFKGDSLKLQANAAYTFTIDKSNPATFGDHRFSVVIRQNPAYVYQLLDFNANKVANTIQVQTVWKTANEANYTRFTVERSIDNGKTFDVIDGFTGTGAGSYSMVDKNPVYGQNLYRLKQEDINDSISYSKVLPVLYSDLNSSNARVQVYPNPAKSNINVSILADANAPCTIRVSNAAGFIIKQATGIMSSWQTSISDLLPGTYIVRVFNGKDSSLVGDTKFVKL